MAKSRTAEQQKALNEQLFAAAQEGDASAIKRFIKDGAEIDARDHNKNIPLHSAAWSGHTDAVKALIEAGAEIDAQNQWRRTPLNRAASHGHTEAMKALLEAGAGVDVQWNDGRYTPLHEAAYIGSTDAVRILLAAGADLTLKNRQEELAGYDCKHPELVDYLQSVADGKTKRPTPKEVGLDITKRNAALETLGKPIPKSVVGEHTAKVLTGMEAQRQAALNDPSEGI